MGMNIDKRLDNLREELIKLLNSRPGSPGNCTGSKIALGLKSLVDRAQRLKIQQDFLQGLTFESMKRRYDAIKEAHRKTFNWMFDRPELGFVTCSSPMIISIG